MKVFISYRRTDTRHFAGRLAERLKHVRGVTDVFFDTESIEGGEDFERRIRRDIVQSDAILVVVGSGWAGDADRLHPFDERDFVRREVREALAGQSRVIPVLVDGALLPRAEQLPGDMQPLLHLNALAVRHDAFDRDMAHLVDAILRRKPPGRVGDFLRLHPVLAAALESVAGAVLALVLLTVALAVYHANSGKSLSDLIGDPGMELVVTLAVLAAGAAAPWVLRRRR